MSSNTINVKSGPHPVVNCPVSVEIEGAPQNPVLEDENGRQIPAQLDGGRLWWIIDEMPAGKESRSTIKSGGQSSSGVDFDETGDGRLEVQIDGEMFTRYHFGSGVPRPFLYPVIGPTGAGVTRNFPMRDDVSEESKDHKHHRSIYVAYGEVNGTDNWSEEKGSARQIHRRFDEVTGGPVFGRITATNDWVSHEGVKQVEEQRTITFYNTGDVCIFDVKVTFKATEGDVHFGDTKEGGIISVRVATTMDANKGGRMVNAIGGTGERECWGKPAHWVDYTGPVDGKTVGIAIFDHPDSFRYPTRWHVRDYGLFTANPFALKHYEPSKGWNGDHTMKKGETLHFHYRLFIHKGDTEQADTKNRYLNFIFPPKAEVG